MPDNAKAPSKAVSAADKVRRPRAATAATRARIIDAATQVFADKGYHNGSLLEIADRSGMTHSGVLHYFGSKDKLLTAVLAHRDMSDVADYKDHLLPSGRGLLDHLVDTAKVNEKRPGIVQAYAVLSAESVTDSHPARDFFRERFQGLRAFIANALREEAPAAVPEHVIAQAASLIIATMDGLQVQWLLEPEVIDMAAIVERAINGTVTQLKEWPD